jgi:uncharacterized protein (TIGR02453 family)
MSFTKGYIDFFKELTVNNNRDWFHANKKRYENEVKKPFNVFVEELLEKTGNTHVPAKNAVFRINRDIRFSKDKRPYKLHMSAVISAGGRKDMQIPGLYVHLEPGNVMIGGGAYYPDKENLSKIRQAIIDDPKRVEKILGHKKFVETFGGLHEAERNKILPKEFKVSGAEHPLIFNKQYYFMAYYKEEEVILREDLVSFILKHDKIGSEWNQFIADAIHL